MAADLRAGGEGPPAGKRIAVERLETTAARQLRTKIDDPVRRDGRDIAA